MEKHSKKSKVFVIGAGPAGLTAGTELLKSKKYTLSIVEKDSTIGGLAKTTEYKDCKFDIGPHHFITDSPWVEKWWKNFMKTDFIFHKRFTRIYYKKHFFHYPLKPLNVIKGLSIFECIHSVLSYLRKRLFPIKNVKTFEDWVSNQFGYRLYNIFFKTYTEKVWGTKCTKISSDWAMQRIKGFSLSKAIFYAFFGKWFTKNTPRTLLNTFYYPSKGSSSLWEKAAQKIERSDYGRIFLNEKVVSIEHNGTEIQSIYTQRKKATQKLLHHHCNYVLSSMSLRNLIMGLDPAAPTKVIKAAKTLKYRGLITVNLIVNKKNICPDHWLYINEESVKMGRIANMNNLSLKMVDKPTHTALILEYFAFVEDSLWNKTDAELLKIGKKELEKIGLVSAKKVIDGMVLKEPEAYPAYDMYYKKHLSIVLKYLSQFKNLHLMGRNGMHQYNNMDIAMLSAKAAVEKMIKQEKNISKKVFHTKKKSAEQQSL
jgi:protoporphyrinogen oxidase